MSGRRGPILTPLKSNVNEGLNRIFVKEKNRLSVLLGNRFNEHVMTFSLKGEF